MSDPTATALAASLEQLIELVVLRVLEHDRRRSPAPESDEQSPWMGVERAAAYLDWPRQRLYKLTARAEIPHYKQDGRLLFHRAELDQWLREFAQPARRLAFSPEQSYRSESR